jgi:SAM-dependent methyltransferase
MTLAALGTLDDFDDWLDRLSPTVVESELAARLGAVFASLPHDLAGMEAIDPFSPVYVEGVCHVLSRITGRACLPETAPTAMPMADPGPGWRPAIFQAGDSNLLGDVLQAFGTALKIMAVKAGARILTYGAGEGQLALILARMGCDVTVVERDPRQLGLIDRQAQELGVAVRTVPGGFGDAPAGETFDRIVFFEALHHAVDHHTMLPRLHGLLAPGGSLLFTGEPVIEPGNPWLATLPYPWGPRLDGISLRTMRRHGLPELAYRRDYFVEALMRAGFMPRFLPGPDSFRGAAYLATPHNGCVELGGETLLDALPGWHAGENDLRWTAATRVFLPLDQTRDWSQLSLTVVNRLPVAQQMKLHCGGVPMETTLGPDEERELLLAPRGRVGRLVIESPLVRLGDFGDKTDQRVVGVAVQQLRYFAPLPGHRPI